MTTDAARARMSHVTRHLPLGQKPLQVNGGEVIVSPHFVKSDDAAARERKPQDTVTCHRSLVTCHLMLLGRCRLPVVRLSVDEEH